MHRLASLPIRCHPQRTFHVRLRCQLIDASRYSHLNNRFRSIISLLTIFCFAVIRQLIYISMIYSSCQHILFSNFCRLLIQFSIGISYRHQQRLIYVNILYSFCQHISFGNFLIIAITIESWLRRHLVVYYMSSLYTIRTIGPITSQFRAIPE